MDKSAEMPLGDYLRSVRESRGLKLEDAAQVTKIGKNYLQAIEEGQFEKLPNIAYIKGFLRLYAGYLSLSGDEVVARYERELPAPAGAAPRTQAEDPLPHPGMANVEKAKFSGHGRFVVPALLLALVIIAAFFFADGEDAPAPPPAPQAPVAVVPAPAPMPLPVQPQLSSAKTDATTTSAPAAAETLPAATAGKQAGIVLRLRFNRDSWLSITIDDAISQSYDLKAGDIIEWKGSRLFVLDLGDGAAVEAEFNGRPLKPLGEPGKPAHVELKAGQTLP